MLLSHVVLFEPARGGARHTLFQHYAEDMLVRGDLFKITGRQLLHHLQGALHHGAAVSVNAGMLRRSTSSVT